MPDIIVQGERDALVLAYHSITLVRAFTNGGNRHVSLLILPNLRHIFNPIVEDKTEAAKISPEFLRTLQTWVTTTLLTAN